MQLISMGYSHQVKSDRRIRPGRLCRWARRVAISVGSGEVNLTTARCLDAESVCLLGMQSLAWEGVDSLLQGGVPGNRSSPGPLHRIADHWVPDVRQVHADLVRAASFERETHETCRPQDSTTW